jgi:hypothetical protein
MKASVGDRILIASNRLDHPLREGRVVEVRHPDGTPPYVVEWFDTGQIGLLFPGPDAFVEHPAAAPGDTQPVRPEAPKPRESSSSPDPAGQPRHVKSWQVEVSLFESGDETSAHAVLVAEVPGIEARGWAHRRPGDADVPEIGDEIAVARALRRLSDRLLGIAADDITEIEGQPVVLAR